jgi:hypothetical protein
MTVIIPLRWTIVLRDASDIPRLRNRERVRRHYARKRVRSEEAGR